jgi:hypothetical protein
MKSRQKREHPVLKYPNEKGQAGLNPPGIIPIRTSHVQWDKSGSNPPGFEINDSISVNYDYFI